MWQGDCKLLVSIWHTVLSVKIWLSVPRSLKALYSFSHGLISGLWRRQRRALGEHAEVSLPYCTCALSDTSSPQRACYCGESVSLNRSTADRQRASFSIRLDCLPSLPCPLSETPTPGCSAANRKSVLSLAVRLFWLCVWCDCAAVWFTHNLGVSAGVFEVAYVQRPSRGAVRSGGLQG